MDGKTNRISYKIAAPLMHQMAEMIQKMVNNSEQLQKRYTRKSDRKVRFEITFRQVELFSSCASRCL